MDQMNSCRCCLQAGPDLDMTTPYTHLDKTEIYSEMLRDCFDLHLTLRGDGLGGICLACVTRLRDASDFKLQVQRCQTELQSWLQYEHHSKDVDLLLVKSECQDGDVNEDEITSESDPLVKSDDKDMNEGETSAAVESATPASRDEAGFASPVSDTGELHAGEPHTGEPHTGEDDYSSDTSEGLGTHTRKERYPCDLCEKDFVNKSALKRHQRVIHGTEKLYTCEECNRKFTTKEYLDKHKTTHNGEEFNCNVCDKKFTEKNDLKLHKKIHVEKPHKCEKCKRRFEHKWLLQRHGKTACQERLYICTVCDKQFAKRVVLKRHLLIHEEKPYGCDECEKRFSRKDELNVHKNIHSAEKPYSCEQCNKQFLTQRSLLRHKISHTGEKHKCTECRAGFTYGAGCAMHPGAGSQGALCPEMRCLRRRRSRRHHVRGAHVTYVMADRGRASAGSKARRETITVFSENRFF